MSSPTISLDLARSPRAAWRASLAVALALCAGLAAAPQTARAEVPWNATVISDVAEKVTPAVVNITTRKERSPANVPFGQHPMFREFFGPEQKRLPPEVGAGSGVVISADGYIVTNNHVIEGADDIKVTFADGRELSAKLIGTDKPADIALVKVEASSLPFLGFGNSASLRLGEIVLAVGNPFGVGQTVTMGIVSAKGRAKMGIIDYEDFIQTDASINPGNSGGALVNLKGELVGINTAIISRSGGAQGIGFAVPSNMVKPIRDQIMEHGRVRRGWLGVAIQDLTPEIARSLDLGDTHGVLISDVMDGGPASKAKLEAGDIVVKANDQGTTSAAELRNSIALMKPGTKVKLSVLRDGKKLELTAMLDEKQDPAEPAGPKPEESDRLLSGLTVEDLDASVRRKLEAPPSVSGVVVTSVEPGSPAESSGLEPRDIITMVNKQRIRSAAELTRLVPKNAREALLRVWRQGFFTFVVLKR